MNNKAFQIILVAIAITVLSGCRNEVASVESIKTSVEMENVSSPSGKTEGSILELVHLGMTEEALREVLNEHDIEITNEIENTSDEKDWNWGNKSLWTEDMSFTFNKDSVLYNIHVEGDEPTATGVQKGDPIERVLSSYGSKFKLYKEQDVFELGYADSITESFEVYEFINDDHYIQLFIKGGTVDRWSISKYKLGTNSTVSEDYGVDSADISKTIKSRLLEDYKTYKNNLQTNKPTVLNQVLASDRARGLLKLDERGVIRLTDEELKDLYDCATQLEKELEDSIVYSGYSSSGLHFLAILSPVFTENEAFNEAVVQLTGDPNEMNFLTQVTEQSDERTLQVGMELLISDLDGSRDKLDVENIQIANSDGTQSVTITSDQEVESLISKFNKIPLKGSHIQIGEWHASVFDGTLIIDPVITVHLKDESITLENN